MLLNIKMSNLFWYAEKIVQGVPLNVVCLFCAFNITRDKEFNILISIILVLLNRTEIGTKFYLLIEPKR